MQVRSTFPYALLLTFAVALFLPARAEDYLRLKNGQTVTCAILRQDTSVVYTTSWDLRSLAQPPLQVYTRDEIESIWFEVPKLALTKVPYLPRPSLLEGGGSFAFQTWAETDLPRRAIAILSLHGGLDITRVVGLQVEGDLSIPFGGKSDSIWKSYKTGYQALMNVVLHPVVWQGLVPFAVFGGGASLGMPIDKVILTSSNDMRTVVDFGLGLKWGSNGVGYAIEWRHHLYSWTPDEEINGVRVPAHDADLSAVRATLFLYR